MQIKHLKPILDFGHGGLIGGIYQTPGKRSPKWELGILYEGMFNRWFGWRLMEELDRKGIPYYCVSPELKDITLIERVNRANKIYKKDKTVYYFSIHANAGGGSGSELYTFYGESFSDKLAENFIDYIETNFKETKFRKDFVDNDSDKEAGFFVLKHTMMPAMLLETAFMDNKTDYKKLWNQGWLEDYVNVVADWIEYIYKKS